MGKLAKVIRLVNLLGHRRYVSLETIMNTCDVPKRTAYRYLNTISEAGIPVFYDRRAQGYCLTQPGYLRVDDFALSDTLILVVALKVLGRLVNGGYSDDVRRVLAKVIERQPFSIEDVLSAFEQRISEEPLEAPMDDLLSAALIQAAVLQNRRVRLVMEEHPNDRVGSDMDSPSLTFDGEWQVVENKDLRDRREPVKKIRKVTIA